MVVMGLGLSLVIAIAGIAVIVGFGRQENGSMVMHRAGDSTYWQPHYSQPSPGQGKHQPNVSDRAEFAHSGSHPAHVPENLWLIVAALFGALVGLLVPAPRLAIERGKKTQDRFRLKKKGGQDEWWVFPDLLGLVAFVVVAIFIFAFAMWGHLGTARDDGILLASAAALLAILIPSPARYDSI
jgi:hypothetical protein